MMTAQWRKLTKSYAWLAILLFIVLMVVNLILLPDIVAPQHLIATLALAAPLVLASMGSTPSILSGGGGVDISAGATIGFINVAIFTLASSLGIHGPTFIILFVLFIGAFIGAINGVLVTLVRLQPIVATLGMNLVLTGISLHLMPQPNGTAPGWLQMLASNMGPIPGPILVVGIPILFWWLLTRLPYHRALMAVGGDDRAAYSSGLPITLIRLAAYTIGGILAAVAGLALTAFVGSGDPTLGANYTLMAIAAATLGGTSLMGGRGGMLGATFGALDIYLIQKVLSTVHISNFWFQVAYGVILLMALVSNSLIRISSDRRVRGVM